MKFETARQRNIPDEKPEKPEKPENKYILKDIVLNYTFIITLILAGIHLFGWVYSYYYFGFFSIGMLELGLDYDDIFMRGIFSLSESQNYILLIVVVWILAGVVIFFKNLPRFFLFILLLIVFIIIFSCICMSAKKSAEVSIKQMVKCAYAGFPYTKLRTKDNNTALQDYLLVIRTENNLYLIKEPTQKEIEFTEKQPKKPDTLSIPLRGVVTMELIPAGTCEEKQTNIKQNSNKKPSNHQKMTNATPLPI